MMPLTWIATKEAKWLSQWDAIQLESPKGMFTQCSSWLMSYQAYGFDYVLFLGVNGEQIHAGFGCLVVKVGPFRLINCNWGPYTDGVVNPIECIRQLQLWSKKQGAIAIQLNVSSEEPEVRFAFEKGGFSFIPGNLMKKVFSPIYFNWISLPNSADPEAERILLKSFSENARRNVKAAVKNDLVLERVNSPEVLRDLYACFENNAAREGYLIRDWKDIQGSLVEAMHLKQSLFFVVRLGNKIIGAIWAAKGGRSYHYIMGGVERTVKDLKVGHLLQWSVILESMKEGMDKYNISVGGSEGVVRFKSSFNPVEAQSGGVFHLVLIPWKYKLFKFGFSIAQRNKKLASKILKLLK